jgi:hypothetical protein
MFKKIEHPNGVISYINPDYIVKADLHPISMQWTICIVNESPIETESFDSVDDALKWFNDNIDQVKQ